MNKSFISIILTLSMLTSLTTGYAMGSAGGADESETTQSRVRPDRSKEEAPKGLVNRAKMGNLKDGTYTGSAEGYSGLVTVEVTVKDNKIVDLKVLSHTETPGYYEKGAGVIQAILAKGSLEVDTISGATLTSRAIIEAATDALSKAGGAPAKKTAAGSRGGQGQRNAAAPAPAAGKTFDSLKDGTYVGYGQGYAGSIGVEVVISGGVISSARMVSGNEDAPYINNALAILDRVIGKKGTAGIDAVSGATFSSNGLLNAVNDALAQASGGPSSSQGAGKAGPTGKNPAAERLKEENQRLKDQLATLQKEKLGGLVPAQLKDGTYEGSAKGYNLKTTVQAVVKDGKLVQVKLVDSDDDKEYLAKALPLLDQMVKKGGTAGVDTVSGATFSSFGLINATNMALAQAGQTGDTSGAMAQAKKEFELTLKKLKEENDRLKQADLSAEGEPPAANWKDGTFTGTARGYKSAVTVEASVSGQKLTGLRVTDHNEDREYFDQAEAVVDAILSKGSTSGVDTVSGATFSSKAILKATVRALRQSAGLAAGSEEAGGSPALEEENKRLKEEVEALNKQLEDSLGDGQLHDGTFIGSAKGYSDGGNNELKLSITVKDKKIVEITVLDRSGETEPYYSDAWDHVVPQIISKQTIKGVDAFSGATITSNAIKNAVRQAMKASFAGSGGDSGALTEALKKKHAEEIKALEEKIRALEAGQGSGPTKPGLDISKIPDGTYHGKGYGYHGSTGPESMAEEEPKKYQKLDGKRTPIEVDVMVAGGRLEKIEITSHDESRPYRNKPFRRVPKAMVDQQKIDVDTVTGATYTSKGLIEAVKNALEGVGTGGHDPGDHPADGEGGTDGQVADLQAQLAAKEAEVAALNDQLASIRTWWKKLFAAWQNAQTEAEGFFGNGEGKAMAREDWQTVTNPINELMTSPETDHFNASAEDKP
ncbi:FMN-binding protein [Peptococcus simiae]|uniref:FMN-binding protein n=1 Tax=Peptococcus simiae TaxID=1643805 RepID=A0ABW9H0K3_9FIRM